MTALGWATLSCPEHLQWKSLIFHNAVIYLIRVEFDETDMNTKLSLNDTRTFQSLAQVEPLKSLNYEFVGSCLSVLSKASWTALLLRLYK